MQKKKSSSVKAEVSDVNIVDGKLIMSFPHADIPVVWQMDLDLARTSSIEVQEDKKRKGFTLVFKSDSSEAKDIATFTEKQDAVNALMDASRALQSAHGKIRPVVQITNSGLVQAQQSGAKNANSRKSSIPGFLLAIALVLVLLLIWGISSVAPLDRTPAPESTSSGISGTTSGASGVPVSADDFLKSVE